MYLSKRLHELFEVLLAAFFAKEFRREVAVHAGSIPVALDRLAMQNDIHFVFLAETHHQIASGPDIVRGLGGAFGEDLEFPLALGDFGVDAFVIDAGGKTEFEVLFDDGAGQAAHVFVADAAVIRALRSSRVSLFREAERTTVFVEEVFLLKTNPQVRIVLDGCAHVGRVRGAIGVHDFAKNDVGVFAAGIGIQRHGFQHAVRLAALGLHGGAAVKAPKGKIGKRRWRSRMI